jgi:hypothetical protein
VIEQLRITKMERHPAGFLTANVTANGQGDPVRVDDSCGSWTFTIDQRQDASAKHARRRGVLPAVAAALEKRRREFERAEQTNETEALSLLEA